MTFLSRIILCVSFLIGGLYSAVAARLPDEVVFVNRAAFERLVARGIQENWSSLPIGERTARVGLAMVGTPYKNYTLELDTRIETPCVNMNGMDCWTFFEIALGTARAFHHNPHPTPEDLLRMIEMDRYRGGKCDGTFASRLHHLEDWAYDNQKRGLVQDLTPRLPGAMKLQREMAYMGKNWKSFRQLKADPKQVPRLQEIETDISTRGIYYIPKKQVPKIEKFLRNGDIIFIVTTWPGTYTSHVGLAARDSAGVLRFLHASRDKRQVVWDVRLSAYLNGISKHQGIMVLRPLDS